MLNNCRNYVLGNKEVMIFKLGKTVKRQYQMYELLLENELMGKEFSEKKLDFEEHVIFLRGRS